MRSELLDILLVFFIFSSTKGYTGMNKKRITQTIIPELKKLYPQAPLALEYKNGFQLLVAVILSAQCTDERVNKVTKDLFKKYKSPKDFIDADEEELQNDIRPTGFYRNKAKSLKTCCEKLVEQFGGEIPKNIDKLTKLPGVGRKTAAMVLGNAFKINEGIAVDTHIKRVVERLDLSEEKSVDKIEKDLMDTVPPEKWTYFSNATILFGRNICQAKKPKCNECPFNNWCPSPDKTI